MTAMKQILVLATLTAATASAKAAQQGADQQQLQQQFEHKDFCVDLPGYSEKCFSISTEKVQCKKVTGPFGKLHFLYQRKGTVVKAQVTKRCQHNNHFSASSPIKSIDLERYLDESSEFVEAQAYQKFLQGKPSACIKQQQKSRNRALKNDEDDDEDDDDEDDEDDEDEDDGKTYGAISKFSTVSMTTIDNKPSTAASYNTSSSMAGMSTRTVAAGAGAASTTIGPNGSSTIVNSSGARSTTTTARPLSTATGLFKAKGAGHSLMLGGLTASTLVMAAGMANGLSLNF